MSENNTIHPTVNSDEQDNMAEFGNESQEFDHPEKEDYGTDYFYCTDCSKTHMDQEDAVIHMQQLSHNVVRTGEKEETMSSLKHLFEDCTMDDCVDCEQRRKDYEELALETTIDKASTPTEEELEYQYQEDN